MQTTTNNQIELIPSDKYIILVDNRNQQRLLKLSTHRKFNWRKTQINLDQLKKHSFYQLLQVGNNTLKRINFDNPDEQSQNQQDEQNNLDGQVKQNNKEIYTLEQAQKLQTQDIQKMKKQKKGQQIINQLVQNNQQFDKRTAYSKAKYLKKKQQKQLFYQKRYIFKFHAEPICLENIHDYYFKNDFKWIGGIRWDMFGLMLLHGGPYRNVLLAQKTKGILLGGALIRGAQQIQVITHELKNLKAFPIIQQLNIQSKARSKVNFSTWQLLTSQQQKNIKYNSFLILGHYDFKSIIEQVQKLDLLELNCSISFFCQSIEPILECFYYLRKNCKNYLNVKMYDSFCREYQVLKNRTHPLMYMDSRSGYILTAIRGQP